MKQIRAFSLGLLGVVSVSAHAKWVTANSAVSKRAEWKVEQSFATSSSLVLRYQAGGFEIKKQGEFSRIEIPGASVMNEKGKPALPVLRWEFEVPSDNIAIRIYDQRYASFSAHEIGLKTFIAPSRGPIVKKRGAFEASRLEKDEIVYGLAEKFPGREAGLVQIGSLRGRQMATLELYPLQYNPVTGETQFLESATLEIIVQNDLMKTDPVRVPSARMDHMISKVAGQSSLVSAESIASQEKILVVAGDAFKNNSQLKNYLDLKKAKGFDVRLVSATEAGKSADAIRAFVQNEYRLSNSASALSYVLLVGDVEQVATYQAETEVTDLYYAAIDKPTFDEDQSYPDLAVGRLTAKTSAELNGILSKLIRYESNRFSSTDWIKKLAFLATDDRYEVAEATHNYVVDTYSKNQGYTGFFPASPQLGGDKVYAITHKAGQSEAVNAVRNGRSIVTYSGHGNYTYWDAPRMTQSDVLSLPKDVGFPFVQSFACISGSYAMEDEDSFGETWLKAEGGAVGFWGTSNNSYWDEDDVLEKAFFDGMFRDNLESVGVKNIYALAAVRRAFAGSDMVPYYHRIYNLLGDPSLEIIKRKSLAQDIFADGLTNFFKIKGLNDDNR